MSGGIEGRPTAGVRYVLERAGDGRAPVGDTLVYRGFAHTPEADLPLEVTIALPGGATQARIEGGTAEMEKAAAALARAATKSELAEGTELPRKIVRWRG